MSRFLVTGGAGFIGSHLVDTLISQNHSVVVLDNLSSGKLENLHPKAILHVGDICDERMVRKSMIGADGVFHLAAVASVQKSTEEWIATHRTNSAGTVTVMEAARSARAGRPIPVVYASSAAVYGAGSPRALKEEDPKTPLTAYGADKLGNELHAKSAGHVHALPSCGFRFFNVYGSRQDPHSPYSGVISIFSTRMANNEPITIFGDGEQTRDFVHVSDVVNHLITGWYFANPMAPVFNVCTGRQTSLNELVSVLRDLTRSKSVTAYAAPRSGDIPKSLGSPEKAIRLLSTAAQVSLREGLYDLLEAEELTTERLAG